MERLPFIDAHAHLWDLAHLRYPWLAPPFADDGPNGSVEPIASTYLPQDYRAETAMLDVRGVIHVDAGADPRDALAETSWLQSLGDDGGLPTVIVAFADLAQPDVDSLLAAHAAYSRVRGIRHIVNWHPDRRRSYAASDITLDESWQRGFAQLARHGLSFDLQAYAGQFPALAQLFERHPDISVIVNHAGMMIPGEEAEWQQGMAALAALPHVSIKLSGFGFTRRPFDPDVARQQIMAVIDHFGVERCMFASNFPTDRLFGTFDTHFSAYLDILADFTPAEQRALYAGNANRIYRMALDL